MTKGIMLLIASLMMALSLAIHDDPPDDTERLGMAIDYFQSGKYHEALLIFAELDEQYDLNPRYHAYMGICYFHEWAYPEACKYLDEAIPQLEGFAPHERSVYYFTDGESHFQLQQYHEAIPYYEKALGVCFENEKGEINYRLGLCYMFEEQWEKARDNYQKALDNYLAYQNTDENRSRILQTAHMLKGCESHLKEMKQLDVVIDLDEKEDKTKALQTDSIQIVETEKQPEEMEKSMETTVQQSFIPSVIPQPIVNTNIPLLNIPVKRDTISAKVPEGINLEDIYQQHVEIQE
ncbi:MAG: tetratricopeptide repeat protein [Prevotella sp.]|nr:tetratricopeptide repeat protein [Prevotella sp.]